MRYAVLLTSFVGIAAITTPTTPAAADATSGPTAGIYVRFIPYGSGGTTTGCSSTPIVSEQNQGSKWPAWHPAQAMSLDMEQVLNIGSQSTGAGAGKITFNPLGITMTPSSLDATLSNNAESGTPFCELDLLVVTSQGPSQLFKLTLAAVKTVAWKMDAGKSLVTNFTFEYGGLVVVNQAYSAAGVAGKATAKGWDRTKNVLVTPTTSDLAIRQLMP